jgi:cell division protease FtsH
MTLQDQNLGKAPPQNAVLRRLARQAVGMSGADIARLVREARQRARRERRALAHADLAALLVSSRPARSPSMRRRMAIHESGHVVARLAYDLGAITLITIDARDGHGFVESIVDEASVQTEGRLAHLIQVYLAGRAAELAVCGEALAGSGGSGKSDLARASALTYALEASLGYGGTMPLLYRDPDDYIAEIRFDPDLAARVNRRLEAAHAAVTTLIRGNLHLLNDLVDALLRHGTLEGGELQDLLADTRSQIDKKSSGCLPPDKVF